MAGEQVLRINDKVWRRVRYAADMVECDCCGEPYCIDCEEHYADCECPGPHMDDCMEYAEFEGYEYATPIGDDDGTDTETE